MMTPISVNELKTIVSDSQWLGEPTGEVTGLTTDHRNVQPGDAFVAIVGQRVDGHLFVEEAFHRGASVAIVTKPVKTIHQPVLLVTDPIKAIQQIALNERRKFLGPVIGITGSNGKTTTKQMVASVFEALGPCLYTAQNRNNELGLPLTILQRKPEHRAIVLEMGMRGFGQIENLCSVAHPTIGIITNIGQSHIELLGSQEGIAKAKGELLDSLPENGHAVLHADDPWLVNISPRSKAPVSWYGMSEGAHVRATQVTWTPHGMAFTARVFGEDVDIVLPTFGLHNVINALAALTAGFLAGITPTDMATQLSTLEELDGRLRFKQGKGKQRIIDDCYNASPLSMTASLDVLQHTTDLASRVAILGDMFELGAYSEEGHRDTGRQVAMAGVQRLLTVGEMSKWIADEAKRHGVPHVRHVESVDAAIAQLSSFIPEESTVLVKASRGMKLEQIVEKLLEN